jgi:hypothetical protein
MWFVVSKKTHQRVLEEWGYAEYEAWQTIAEQDQSIADKDAILKSTEREKVLTDLRAALNLVRGYQHSLSVASYSDPQIIEANGLLEKYGMKGEATATYLGFKQAGAVQVPKATHPDHVELDALLDVPTERPETRWEREEKKWGTEAYGSGNVRIEAVAIDEGKDKEPGYTRAHVQFVDLDAEPETLTDAKEAGWSPPDDDLASS